MSEAIITVEGLGKRYRLGASGSGERSIALRDVIASSVSAPFRRLRERRSRSQLAAGSSGRSSNSDLQSSSSAPQNDFWALKDINFEVQQGEISAASTEIRVASTSSNV